MSDWRAALRSARERACITQRTAARLAGLSVETVRGYESGRRHPRAEQLKRLLEALDLPADASNEILRGAGFAPAETLFPESQFPRYHYSIDELQTAVEEVGWPEFVANETVEIVAANAAAQALWGVDFAKDRRTRTAVQMNLLSVASERSFADRMVNWDECISTLAAIAKGRPQRPQSMDNPNPYFAQVLSEFASRDPAFVERLIPIWAATDAREPKVRWSYRVHWREPGIGDMRFLSLVSTASEPDALSFNDWIPSDAESWSRLEQLKARARSR